MSSSIDRADPLSAHWSGSYSMSLQRDNWDIKTESNFQLTSDKANFYITTDLIAYEHGEIVFTREWTDTIARDLA